MKNRGVTLIELVFVITLVSVLVGIIVPRIGEHVQIIRLDAERTRVRSLVREAQQRAQTENRTYRVIFDTVNHKMHAEWGRIDAATADRLNAVKARGGRVIAVGTTSLRLIESAAGEDGVIRPFEGDTAIFITPGYRFRGIDGLMTNFHLPRSTLFMLVSALMGLDRMQAAYAHAIAQGYRFYSYGDASLLLPGQAA